MYKTDEEVIDAYLEEGTEKKAAERLGTTQNAINSRLYKLRNAGVKVPKMNPTGAKYRMNAERVQALNAYIEKKGYNR